MKEGKTTDFVIINEEGRIGLNKQLMVGGIAGATVTTGIIKIGDYEEYPLFPGAGWFMQPGLIMGGFPVREERPSMSINREIDEIPIVILEYEDGFTAYPLDIDGVVSQGDDLSEAVDNLEKAISLHLEAFGIDVLLPKSDRSKKIFLTKMRLPKQEIKNAEDAT